MAQTTPFELRSDDVQYKCIIKRVAPYGMHVDISDLNAEGLLRITELAEPAILQDHACVGTEIVARILGKETPDGPYILSQR